MSLEPNNPQLINPYAAPQAAIDPLPVEAANRRLYEIAKAQIFLIQVLLFAICATVAMQVFRAPIVQHLTPWFFVVVQLILSALQSFAMFRMGRTVHNMFQAVGLAIFSFVPCIGMLLMLLVNGQATAALRSGGIKVGFLGANLEQFDPAIRNAAAS